MALIVHVKAVIDGVTLYIGDETGNIDDSQLAPFCAESAQQAMP